MSVRNEYPRPQLQRERWMNLNGQWQFSFDDDFVGFKENWQKPGFELDMKIEVPFAPESKMSGIGDPSRHEHVWYKRKFTVPSDWDEEIVLHIGAADYISKVFINGNMLTEHVGGNVPISVNITDALVGDWRNGEEQEVAVYCYDPSYDESIPRGKQSWTDESQGIWYTRTTGIWQTVWLEPVSEYHIDRIKLTPDIDKGVIEIDLDVAGTTTKVPERRFQDKLSYNIKISFEGELIADQRVLITEFSNNKQVIDVFGLKSFNGLSHGFRRCWSPENPRLYDLEISLFKNDIEVDKIDSYFGMRKVSIDKGQLYLNNRPYYPKLILDQGYWPESLMTAPSDQAFIDDINFTKAFGFNGCRKHQKIEDPRFLYWADKIGFLVTGEMASSSVYTEQGALNYEREWMEAVVRDYNHPSIIAWVPFNESWGVPNIRDNKYQQAHTLSVYHLIKSIDQTRPVVNNDGWVLTETDICAIHCYSHGNPDREDEQDKVEFFKRFTKEKDLLLSTYAADLPIFADGFEYKGQPIMLTEVGGIAYQNDESDSWGYTQANDEDAFLRQFDHVISSILESPVVSGLCYTQLTDVEQETNGLLTYDRKPKVDPEKIKKIMDKWRPRIVMDN